MLRYTLGLVILLSILQAISDQAYAETEVRCIQIVRNYARIASNDKTLPSLFDVKLKFKPDKVLKETFETELEEASNGADVNMTCYRDGTLMGFDIRFRGGTSLATAEKFFAAILASIKPGSSQTGFVELEMRRAIQDANQSAASDFDASTTVIFHVGDPLHPEMMVDRTQRQ